MKIFSLFEELLSRRKGILRSGKGEQGSCYKLTDSSFDSALKGWGCSELSIQTKHPSLFAPEKTLGEVSVEIDGRFKILPIEEFEEIVQTKIISELDFKNFTTKQKVISKTKKLYEKGLLSRNQLWMGSYYRKELENMRLPDVQLRWINEEIGWGVFAKRNFKQGEFIGEYIGTVRKRQRFDKKNAYCFEYLLCPERASDYIIDAKDCGGLARFINHSSAPNVLPALATIDWITHVIFIADTMIPKGSQLFYNYGPDYWSHRAEPKELVNIF